MGNDRDDYRGDVLYEVWRSGGDIDRVDYDRVDDCQWEGVFYEDCARIEMRHQQPPEPFYDPMEEMDEYYRGFDE